MNILTYKSGNDLNKIVEKLSEGKLVVYPTDTIYGIGADINNLNAVKKVFSTKRRSFSKPLSVCFHDLKQLSNYVFLNDKSMNIIKKLLPGQYTLLLYKKDNLDSLITSNSPVVGVRMPDNVVCYELTKNFPITTTSANISNQKTPNNIQDIIKILGDNVDYYIDYGIVTNNEASTIIDLTKDKPSIVRKGACDEKVLDKILKID